MAKLSRAQILAAGGGGSGPLAIACRCTPDHSRYNRKRWGHILPLPQPFTSCKQIQKQICEQIPFKERENISVVWKVEKSRCTEKRLKVCRNPVQLCLTVPPRCCCCRKVTGNKLIPIGRKPKIVNSTLKGNCGLIQRQTNNPNTREQMLNEIILDCLEKSKCARGNKSKEGVSNTHVRCYTGSLSPLYCVINFPNFVFLLFTFKYA